MRIVVVLALGWLAACSNAGQAEEDKYRIVERQNATFPESYRYRELCKQGRAVAQAYLDARDEQKYKDWKLKSDIECGLADLN